MVSEEEAPMKDVEFLIGEEIVKETVAGEGKRCILSSKG